MQLQPADMAAKRAASNLAIRVLSPEEVLVEPMQWREASNAPAIPSRMPPRPTDEHPENQAVAADWRRRVDEARAAGAREGESAGRAKALAELQPVIERSARAISELANYKPTLRKQAEADTVRLALAIARRILRREIAADPDALRGLVVAALEKLQAQEISRVKVHPSQASQIAGFIARTAPSIRVEVVPEPSLASGALIFETNHGNLDVSVESQLQEIERGLADRLQRYS